VRYSVLQCVAVCCSLLLFIYSTYWLTFEIRPIFGVPACVYMCVICVCAVYTYTYAQVNIEIILRDEKRVAASCSELQWVAVSCSVLQCVAVCCRVLQRVYATYSFRFTIFLGVPIILSLLNDSSIPTSAVLSHFKWYHLRIIPPSILPFFLPV